jgi:hypothetical protein
MEVLCIGKRQSVIYFEDTKWISILAFLDVCGQLNGLRRKLERKLYVNCIVFVSFTSFEQQNLSVSKCPENVAKMQVKGFGILDTERL